MASNSALAGDSTHAGWGDKKPQAVGGWNERRSRWREDERDVAGARARRRRHGWTADRRDRARGREGASFPAPCPRTRPAAEALLSDGNGNATRDARPRGTAARTRRDRTRRRSGGDSRSSARRPVRAGAARRRRWGGTRDPTVAGASPWGAGAAASAPRVPRARSHSHPAPARRPQTGPRASGWEASFSAAAAAAAAAAAWVPSPVRRRSRAAHGAFGRRPARGPSVARARAFQVHAPELRSSARAGRRRAPAPVDPDSVPLSTVKPGDAM